MNSDLLDKQNSNLSDIEKIVNFLKNKNLKIAFAESCTGGLLSANFSELPGVSEVFEGSVISYSNRVKQNILKVTDHSLTDHGAVSSNVVMEMARGVCHQLESDIGIAISGIAGPSGGSESKPVGTVFFAFKGPKFEFAIHKKFDGTRIEIQQQSVQFAIRTLMETLLN